MTRLLRVRFSLVLLVAALTSVVLLSEGRVAQALTVREWTGDALTPNWSDPGNWKDNGVPVDGDFAVFVQVHPTRPDTLINDIPGLSLARLTFNNETFTISGNSLEITELIGLEDAFGVELQLPITGPGEIIVGPDSILTLSGNNTFSGQVDVRGILVVASNTALGSTSGITRTTTPGQIRIAAEVTDIGQEMLRIQGDGNGPDGGLFGALAVLPPEFTIANLEVVEDSVVTAAGVLNLPGGFQTFLDSGRLELRYGTFVFSGPSDQTGTIRLTRGGDLVWNSSAEFLLVEAIPFVPSPGDPPPDPPFESYFWGGGTLGEAVVSTGEISPRSGSTPTRLTIVDDFFLTNASLSVLLNGSAPGTGYSQLAVGDRVSLLAGATLELDLGFEPPVATTFIVLNTVRVTESVQGTFAGLPEGANFELDGKAWSITYAGGDGNDVVITYEGLADPRPFKRTVPMVARE